MALTKVRRGGTDTGISDSSDATAITIDSNENITTTNAGTITAGRFINGTSSNDPWLKGVNSSGTETFFVKPDGTLHAEGNVLFGTTGTGITTEGTVIYGSGNEGVAQFSTTDKIAIYLNRSNTGEIVSIRTGNVAKGGITVNSGSVSFNTSSDYRLKENVNTDWDATSRLKQLKPSRFNFKVDKDTTFDGFLAHEVSSIVPEAITGEKDAVDKDGNPIHQGIDQSKLVPLLVKTIQELEARIATLESK
jgi:hypothetical protein|tara:strand:- start:158 stop:904 length:747 start_codon:yes stop_codon:yes gene_type:complete